MHTPLTKVVVSAARIQRRGRCAREGSSLKVVYGIWQCQPARRTSSQDTHARAQRGERGGGTSAGERAERIHPPDTTLAACPAHAIRSKRSRPPPPLVLSVSTHNLLMSTARLFAGAPRLAQRGRSTQPTRKPVAGMPTWTGDTSSEAIAGEGEVGLAVGAAQAGKGPQGGFAAWWGCRAGARKRRGRAAVAFSQPGRGILG